jgi:hypothetical protein
MIDGWGVGAEFGFGTATACFVVLVFLSTIPFCVYRRRWPSVGHVVIMLLGSAGAASGLKITLLTVAASAPVLGALASDRLSLIVGGIATLLVSASEATGAWRKITVG